jgi:hypothetical protein
MLVSRAPSFVTSLCLLGKLAPTGKDKTYVPSIYLPAPFPSEAPQTYLSATHAIIPASVDKVWEYAGDFYDLSWISKNIFPFLTHPLLTSIPDLSILSTTGSDNAAGATRTFFYGFNVTETLLQYIDSPQVKYYVYSFSLDHSTPSTIGVLYSQSCEPGEGDECHDECRCGPDQIRMRVYISIIREYILTNSTDSQRRCADNGDNDAVLWAESHNAGLAGLISHFE